MSFELKNKVKTVIKITDGNKLVFTCEECGGEYLDTKVELNGVELCWITFENIGAFESDFNAVLGKYRI